MPLGHRLGGEEKFAHVSLWPGRKNGAPRIADVALRNAHPGWASALAAARARRLPRVGHVWAVAHIPAPSARQPAGRGLWRRSADAPRGDRLRGAAPDGASLRVAAAARRADETGPHRGPG